MTADEAEKIIGVWSKHLEIYGETLVVLFSGGIPKALLPAPIELIEQALNIIAKRYHDLQDYTAAKIVKDSFGQLMLYGDDNKALQYAALRFGDAEIRSTIIAQLGKRFTSI